MSAFALVSIRSSIASHRVGVSITWLKKLSSMNSRKSRGLPAAHSAIFPADVGVVEVPQQDETLQVQSLLELEDESFISRLPWIMEPVVDTYDQVPFVVSVSDSYP